MSVRVSSRWLVPGLCLIVGYCAGGGSIPWLHAQAPITAVAAPPFAMAHRLGSNLWFETAPEYRALCLQTYRLAGERLDALLRCRPIAKPPAVVLDLDETVFDNSSFQTFLFNTGQEYTDALWEIYEEKYTHDIGLVPGALEFIRKAESMGVTVIYISNRLDRLRGSTIAALNNLGFNTKDIDARLGLKQANGTSDKTARRAAFAANHDVLLYIGDNLRDFSEMFVAPKLPPDAPSAAFDQAIAARLKQADDCACHWGVDWIVLPNPIYGEWDKILGPRPLERLRPTSMR